MANYIKIPLAINPPRSFKLQSLADVAEWADATGTLVAGTDVTGQAVLGGSGSGAVATIAISGTNLGTVDAEITTAGEGYKVGDVITFAANTTGGGAAEWSEPIAFTIQQVDLVDSEGSTTNEYYLVDVDTIMTVDYNFSVANQMRLWVNELTAGTTPARITLQFDDTPATNDGKIGQDLSEAIIKAIEAPNSVPTVDFTDDVELLTIDLT